MTPAPRIAAGLLAALLALAPAAGLAAEAAPRVGEADWPCVQRFVPTIAAGQIWPGEAPAPGAGQGDKAVERLAAEIAVRRTPLARAEDAVARFADTLTPGERNQRLGALVNQMLKRINGDRASLIAGIERFAKRQRALAERIRERRHDLGELPADDVRRADLAEVVDWDQRIFDERRGSLTYLCEQPVLLEQRAFALAREIYNHVDAQ